MKWKLIRLLLWPVEKTFWLIGGGAAGLAGLTLMDICGLIVPGMHVITYAKEWLAIWSAIALVFIGLMLWIALLRDRLHERTKPFALRASWVLGEDGGQCFVPKGPGALGRTLCNGVQWKGRNWVTIESSFPGWTPVRKANPAKAYFIKTAE